MRRIASPLIATALVAATLMAGFTDASSGLLASEDIESAPSIVTPRPDPALLIDPKPVERTVPSTPEPCDELGNRGRCGGPDRLAPEPPELVPDEISSVDDWRPLVARYFDQEDVALVRDATLGVEVKLASQIRQIIPAMVSRQVPSADHELPSPSLGLSGGGRIAVDPTDQKGTTSLESSFKFDLRLPIQKTHPPLGSRAYVRFDHGYETLGSRWYRTVRQLLLTRLAV